LKRTHYCGALREEHIGQFVTAAGWVLNKRDMGGVLFIDLRDREGVLQVVFDLKNVSPEHFQMAEGLRLQSVITVSGPIRLRDAETVNPKIDTGTVEMKAESLDILSVAKPLPFSLEEDTKVREELRLQYRFLDIRRPAMLSALKLRNLTQKAAEDYLQADGFLQVETPILTKSTPEGARDYLVPSRVHPGTFYALPQSPQIFKQLLMVGGIDKYYQVARCFRDEDLRADRQPEFTQVDMELSFVDQEDILTHLVKLFTYVFKFVMGREIPHPFLRMTWQEAMDRYGCDKPDLRFEIPIVDLTGLAKACSFSVFRQATERGGLVRAINCRGCGEKFARSTIEELTDKAVSLGAKGMAWILIRENGEINSILQKYFTPAEFTALLDRMEAGPGDFILFCADKFETVCRVLCGLRLAVGDMLGLRPKDDFQFVLVTDFPEFEYSSEENRFVAAHHPFTMPYAEDIPYLTSDPGRVRAQSYDVVLNGVELGSGSIRIHQRDIQEKMFEALGFSKEESERRFGFLLKAFQYGTPPHGGFAFGLDRLVMLLLGADSLRDVIAFPKTKDASCLMTDAPDYVDQAQLDILKLGASKGQETAHKHKASVPQIQVEQVAALAKLHLTPAEQTRLGGELQAIIAFADQLSEVDTLDVPITAHVVPVSNVFREDIPFMEIDRETLLKNAPTKDSGFITVPLTVE
jgi:aspartyl-tRNA synthetase